LYRQWNPHDIDLATTLLQISHPMGGYGMTPNAIAQISTKVAMASRFLGLISSLPPHEQILWFSNQTVQDPDTWTLPHLIQVKHEYKKFEDHYHSVVQELCTVKTHQLPYLIFCFFLPLQSFIRLLCSFRNSLSSRVS
jgi:hypothetical protein